MVATTQRWRERRDSYRPAGEPINTVAYDVVPIAEDSIAKVFVRRHHYSGSYPAARFRFGLYRHAELVGVAVFSHPCSDHVLTRVFPGPALSSVELGRFVLLDDVPANGETWFLARCFEGLRRVGIGGVVSFSDPIARTRADGSRVFPGHVGTIYQAANAVYLGRGKGQTLKLLPDGRVLSHRAVTKIRAGDRGWRAAAAILEGLGAGAAPDAADDRRAWLAEAVATYTRPLSHPGNHKYAWGLARSTRRVLSVSLPYPKRVAA
jgi:hypothetical protein